MKTVRLAADWKPGQDIVREDAVSSSTPPTPAAPPAPEPAAPVKHGAATAFYVSAEGHAVTNAHVTADCREVRVAGREGAIKVLSADAKNNLALLDIPRRSGPFARLAADSEPPRQGQAIFVFGFPLNPPLSANITPGMVSSPFGLDHDSSQMQITAPIQPGSSGSPVLNTRGEVIGVVSKKLDELAMAKKVGTPTQNVNFAVLGPSLAAFLRANQVPYETMGWFERLFGGVGSNKSNAVADEARTWTLAVECWK